GIPDEEETTYGEDCMISDPFHEDGDGDGILDSEDPYPLDPFPEFVLNANDEGSIYFYLSNRDGTFGPRLEWGADIGTDYRVFAIADFDDDGKMDFLAHSATTDGNSQYQMYFFYRTYKEDEFVQVLVGNTALRAGGGIVADVNGDHLFDVVVPVVDKPEYIASVTGYTFLNNGTILTAPCAVSDYPDTSCAFTRRSSFYLGAGSPVVDQWGFMMAKQAVDITQDGHKDVVIGIYPHGGTCSTTIYVLEGVGDGTFDSTPRQVLVHSLSAVNSLVFADFTLDQVGDVIMGMDDDGDAGQAWLYTGNGSGGFNSTPIPALDLEPLIESGHDNIGVTTTARTFDFDFDGAMDIMVSHNVGASPYDDGPSIIELYRGQGDGTFFEPTLVGTQIPTGLGNTFEIPQRLCPWYELEE
ncbi:MAG: VCBS repeat-containing protein, partial [Bradymonadales bacterium]|nr:VCBS repeat-containing protein [Bradymonadales bacterium]